MYQAFKVHVYLIISRVVCCCKSLRNSSSYNVNINIMAPGRWREKFRNPQGRKMASITLTHGHWGVRAGERTFRPSICHCQKLHQILTSVFQLESVARPMSRCPGNMHRQGNVSLPSVRTDSVAAFEKVNYPNGLGSKSVLLIDGV